MSAFPAQPTSGGPSGETPRRRVSGRHLRRRDALHVYSLHFGPNMTPMVDVVMVILIFFMASAAFLGNEWFLRAAIPFEAGRGRDATKPNDPLAVSATRVDVIIDVDATGNTILSFLGQARVSMEEFEKRIGAFPRNDATRNIEVVLRPTSRVPYQDLVRAHAACDAVGIYKVGYGLGKPIAPATTPAGVP